MRFYLFLIVLFSLLGQNTQAQNIITGTVTDSLNVPVPFASVYLSKTTIGDMTKKDGTWSITIPQSGEYELIASFIGYKTFKKTIHAEGKKLNIDIKLMPDLVQVDEVTIQTKDKNRIKNYTVFTKLFLGESLNAQNCRILNVDDLYLRKEAGSDIIKGRSLKPLQIDNRSLGYKISYDLTDFIYDPKSGFLRFSGNPYFRQYEGNPKEIKKWNQHRLRAYYGSRMHFFRSLFKDSLIRDQFKVSNYEIELTKTKSGIPDQKIRPLQENSLGVTRESNYMSLFSSRPLLISYYDNRPELSDALIGFEPRNYESTLSLSKRIKVYQNGYNPDPYSATWGGAMAEERIADMLPDDFQPYLPMRTTPDSVVAETPIEKYFSQRKSSCRDQVFVQIDRNIYRPGDTIYFQAYIRNRLTGNFESSGVSLYALLFNEKRELADSARLRIENSTASGWLTVPVKAETGKYHFTAFTGMMQNGDPSDAFQLDLLVRNPGSLPVPGAKSVALENPEPGKSPEGNNTCYELRFLPEGGTYIEGVRQRIGFNATNAKGEPVYIEGLLKNRSEMILDTIRSGSFGPGSFICSAQKGLYVEIIKGAGLQKIWPLPTPAPEGLCLGIKPIDQHSFAIEIQSDYYLGEPVTVVGSMNSMQFFMQEITLDKRQRIVVETGDLPAGIAEITLFNKEQLPVAERLYSINSDKRLQFDIVPGNKMPAKGEDTELKISVKDGNGNPAEGFFSIAVTDSVNGIDGTLFAPGINYALNYHPVFPGNLPAPVLARGIENLTDAERNLILMVYGWRRYITDSTKSRNNSRQPVNYELMNILVLNAKKNRKAESSLNLYSPEGPYIRQLETNNTGEILWPLDSLPGQIRTVTLMPDMKSNNSATEAIISIPSNLQYLKSDKLVIPQPLFSMDIPKQVQLPQYTPFEENAIEIKEVTVVGHPANKKVFKDKQEEFYQHTFVKSLEPEMLQSSTNLETAIRKLVSPYKWTATNIYLRSPRSILAGPVPALVVLDGMPIFPNGWAMVSNLNINEVTSITILTSQQGYIRYGDGAQGGVIFINTRSQGSGNLAGQPSGKNALNKNSIMLKPVQIFRPEFEFYVPARLEGNEDPLLPGRATLYWNPEVYSNGKDPVKIKYNNLKHTGPIVITINGVSVNNLIGTGKGGYKIQ